MGIMVLCKCHIMVFHKSSTFSTWSSQMKLPPLNSIP